MKNVIRAWKDPIYRASLSPEEQIESPAGMIELNGTDLDSVAGGGGCNSGKGSGSGGGRSHKSSGKSGKSGGSGKSGKSGRSGGSGKSGKC